MKIRKKLWIWFFSLFVITILSFRNAPPLTWVAIGDSITYLNDHLEETDYRVSKGYLTSVTEKLKNMQYLNLGRNGWAAVEFAKNLDRIDFGKDEVYTIFLGTNDWWQGRPVGSLADYTSRRGAQTFYGAIRAIMDKIRGLNSYASIILITPMQRTDFVYIADHSNNAFGSYKHLWEINQEYVRYTFRRRK